MVIKRIKPFTYRLLQKCAKGGQFEYESCFRNGYYLIEIDVPAFSPLMEIASDVIDKAIIGAV